MAGGRKFLGSRGFHVVSVCLLQEAQNFKSLFKAKPENKPILKPKYKKERGPGTNTKKTLHKVVYSWYLAAVRIPGIKYMFDKRGDGKITLTRGQGYFCFFFLGCHEMQLLQLPGGVADC